MRISPIFVKGLGHRPTCILPKKHSEPVLHPGLTPQEVYEKDKREILNANYLIAYVGKPSLGVGTEIELAKENNIPIIMLYEEGASISRVAKGNPSVIKEIAFSDSASGINELWRYLKKMPTNPFMLEAYQEHSEFMAKRIAALTPATPSAVLTLGILELLNKIPSFTTLLARK